ncbi:RING-H2 finger protein ATL43-like [Tasmannia lanceolata]|uniref:RING-H2 finger protein ATL43-like n=1 Tax=Tasmannia lanceolata TaxID=3420 RepID=UPI0040645B7D
MPLSRRSSIFSINPPKSSPSLSELEMGFSKSFTFCLFLCFFFFQAFMAQDQIETPSNSTNTTNPPQSPSSLPKSNIAPFRPSIAVIVGVLTTMFSITFLLLLYAKHCKRSGVGVIGYGVSPGANPASTQRNSGIDRTVVESLPIFRFGSLSGQKDGLECAVCLNLFESTAVLRLLPKCKHAFHVECVDTWLDAHSTCPLCRYRVDPEDVLLVEESDCFPLKKPQEPHQEEKQRNSRNRDESPGTEIGYRRISGRHSSAGEKSSSSDTPAGISRRSADQTNLRKAEVEKVSVGCFDRGGGRKDGLLLPEEVSGTPENDRRLEHRIIVSDTGGPLPPRRWSDLKPSDVLFLRSEMIITDSGRYSLSCARGSCCAKQKGVDEIAVRVREENGGSGSSVINSRCVSEITGLSRFRREEEEKTVNRWLGFRTPHWVNGRESNGSSTK